MAFLSKVEENYSEVSVSQPYVPTKCICRLWQCIKGEGALCPAENSNTRARRPCLGDVGPGQALSGQHHLSHWYLKWHQQILCKWQPEIYNCTLRESLYTKKKGKQKEMFNVFQILIGEIITLGDPSETVAANYREMTTLIICCLCCKYHPLFLKIQGCYLHVCCTQGSVSPVGQHRRLPNYILLWQKNNWFASACVSKYIRLWSSYINCIKYA